VRLRGARRAARGAGPMPTTRTWHVVADDADLDGDGDDDDGDPVSRREGGKGTAALLAEQKVAVRSAA